MNMQTLRRSLIALSTIALVGIFFLNLPSEAQEGANMRDYGAAPELLNKNWINSETPLRLEALRGSVVLLEFWTYDCINCIHTIPTIEGWHETYADQGLQVIGIHFPELSWERDFQNVYAAAQRMNITYPIGIDNDGASWDAYAQRYWPTIYLIDRQGIIRYVRIGEGGYAETEQAIQALLAEAPITPEATAQPSDLVYVTPDISLNVRAAATTDSAIIGAVQPGMSFVILAQQDGWYQISYNDGVGYLSADLVTLHGA